MVCANISRASTQSKLMCVSHHVAVKSDQHAVDAICFLHRGVVWCTHNTCACYSTLIFASSRGERCANTYTQCRRSARFIVSHLDAEPAARPSAAQLADYTRRESVSPEFQPCLPAQNSARELRWSAHMDFCLVRASGGEIINREREDTPRVRVADKIKSLGDPPPTHTRCD